MSRPRADVRPPPAALAGLVPFTMRALVTALVTALVATLAPTEAGAHARSVSYSAWVFDDAGATVSLRLPLLELSRLGPDALAAELFDASGPGAADVDRDPLATRLASDLALSVGAARCPPVAPIRRRVERTGWVRYAWRVACPAASGDLAIESRILLDVAPGHLHFARVRFDDAPRGIREQVLTEAMPRFVVRPDATSARSDEVVGGRFRDYLRLGIDHIFTGWDHLAFLLGLVLLANRLSEVARLVTGFTLAHSLTLALTVAGLLHPRPEAVEAVIAFSVALVAAEGAWHAAGRGLTIPIGALVVLAGLAAAALAGRSSLPLASALGLMLFTVCHFASSARPDAVWTRMALSFAFGLVHGFGFAGILVELDLPRDRLVPALAGFNLGVELGQIAIVVLLWPALRLAARTFPAPTRRLAGDLATASLCGLGCFWLYSRALGA
ncbi:MAG: HupE/UreJ family protein [Myxococcota bacterium]